MSTFDELLRDGHRYQLLALIDGIPKGFSETEGLLAEPRGWQTTDSWEAGDFGSWQNAGVRSWTNHTGATPTANTGPDAAYQVVGGSRYLYCECDGASAGDTYDLVQSTAIDLTNRFYVDVQFLVGVHMYGATIGTLSIQVEDQAAPGTWTTLWSRTGQWQTASSDPWQSVRLSLAAYLGRSIKLRIRYVRGSGPTGDAAVDMATLEYYTIEPSLPADVDAVVPALLLGEDQAFVQELDRETGVARGDAFDLTLSWVGLEAAGLVSALFTRGRRARLTADFSTVAASASVDTTDGWPSSGAAYIGRERISYTGKTATSFTGITHLGPNKRPYKASSPTSFGFVTEKPEVWIGRQGVIYMVLLSPEGRMLGSSWDDPTYSRVIWRFYIDEDPDDGEHGKILRTLPLVRLGATEIGKDVTAQVLVPPSDDQIPLNPIGIPNFYELGEMPVYMPADVEVMRLRGTWTGGGGGSFDVGIKTLTAGVASINLWCIQLQGQLQAALAAYPWFDRCEFGVNVTYYSNARGGPRQVHLRIWYDAPTYDVPLLVLTIAKAPATYWITDCQIEGRKSLVGSEPAWHFSDGLPALRFDYPIGSWLPVFQTAGAGFMDFLVPSSGMSLGVLEADGKMEIIRWDLVQQMQAPMAQVVLIRLVERGGSGTGPVDLSVGTVTLKLVAGMSGTLKVVFLTMLQSSGTGANGTYDTLADGYGLDDALMDESAFASFDLDATPITAVAGGRASIESLLGGWLALLGKCLVQRRIADGSYRLTLVDTEPRALTLGLQLPLRPNDVELNGVGRPSSIRATNEVLIERSGVDAKVPPIRVGDSTAILASRARSAKFTAPSMSDTLGIRLATARLLQGPRKHQDVSVSPWFPAQIGDHIENDTGHPSNLNPTTGARGAGSLPAIVAGDRFVPYSGQRRLILRHAGLTVESNNFCPVFSIVSKPNSTDLVLSAADAQRLADYLGLTDLTTLDENFTDLSLRLYNPGEESTEAGVYQFNGINSTTTIRATAALPAWVADGTTRITWPPTVDAVSEQKNGWMFQGSSFIFGVD